MTATKTLAEALAAVQADLPEVRKGETAKVPTKTGGSYSYSYADLAAVSRAVLPRLGQVGLSWTTKPTLVDGRFVLVYKLLHVSGECEEGSYPLPDRGSPQEIGSAITYARRYALCSITGVAPADDDDAAEATAGHRRNHEMSRARGDEWESARPAEQRPGKRATELAAQIGKAKTKDDLADVWRVINACTVDEKITAAESTELRRLWADRKAKVIPPDGKNPGNDPKRRRMFKLLGDAEMSERDAYMPYVVGIVGREITSTNDLTDDEVTAVIETVEKYLQQSQPAEVPA